MVERGSIDAICYFSELNNPNIRVVGGKGVKFIKLPGFALPQFKMVETKMTGGYGRLLAFAHTTYYKPVENTSAVIKAMQSAA